MESVHQVGFRDEGLFYEESLSLYSLDIAVILLKLKIQRQSVRTERHSLRIRGHGFKIVIKRTYSQRRIN